MATHRRANVAYAALRELGDTRACGRVHNELAVRIARVRTEGTALLLGRRAVRTGGRCTVMHGTKGVARFMSKDLPFLGSPDDHIRSRDRLVVVVVRTGHTQLTQPGEPDSGIGRTGAQESPVCVGVVVLATPLGKEVEPVRYGDTAGACHIPRRLCACSAWAIAGTDGEILNAQGDVESALVQLRSSVYLVDDVGTDSSLIGEVGGVGTVSGNSDQSDLTGSRTASRGPNGRDQVRTCAVPTGRAIDGLPAEQKARSPRTPRETTFGAIAQ